MSPTELTLDPVMHDAYAATDDVEVRYAFAPLDSPANNGIWIDAANALAWRYAVESLGVEVRPYADDEEPVIYVNWTDAEYEEFTHTRVNTKGYQDGFQDRIWNAEYAGVPDDQRPLTREWYESSEGFGQAQIHVLSIYGGGDPANPDDWVDVTYKPTWEELEAEATKIYEAFSLTDDTVTLSPDEESRDGLDVLVDDAALAEVFVNPYTGSLRTVPA